VLLFEEHPLDKSRSFRNDQAFDPHRDGSGLCGRERHPCCRHHLAQRARTAATTTSGVPLQVQVERTTLHQVVVVPLSAIANPYGRTTVSVQSGKVRKQVAVTVIARSASKVAVSGLRPGATVYLLPS